MTLAVWCDSEWSSVVSVKVSRVGAAVINRQCLILKPRGHQPLAPLLEFETKVSVCVYVCVCVQTCEVCHTKS